MKALPRFSVGELAILQSVNQPDYDGEYTIKEIKYAENIKEVVTKEEITGYWYNLGFYSNKGNNFWFEKSLRKKQEPSEMSFMQLMGSLNTEEKV